MFRRKTITSPSDGERCVWTAVVPLWGLQRLCLPIELHQLARVPRLKKRLATPPARLPTITVQENPEHPLPERFFALHQPQTLPVTVHPFWRVLYLHLG